TGRDGRRLISNPTTRTLSRYRLRIRPDLVPPFKREHDMSHTAQTPASMMHRRRLLVTTAAAGGVAMLSPAVVFARGAMAGSAVFNITEAAVNGAKPYVITQPGYYRLTEDIGWTTRDTNAKGIDIR